MLCLLTSLAHASGGVGELELRNKSDFAEAGGHEYEMEAVRAFWGSPHFMMQCLPPGSPIHAPFKIFFEILPNGTMGELKFTKKTKITECIAKNVKERHFPKPIKPFVVGINMKFTE